MHARRALTTAALTLSLGSAAACSVGGGTTDEATGPGGESTTVGVATPAAWARAMRRGGAGSAFR